MPEPRRCPDEGACHHGCAPGECFRVAACSPLSAYGETWRDLHHPLGERWSRNHPDPPEPELPDRVEVSALTLLALLGAKRGTVEWREAAGFARLALAAGAEQQRFVADLEAAMAEPLEDTEPRGCWHLPAGGDEFDRQAAATPPGCPSCGVGPDDECSMECPSRPVCGHHNEPLEAPTASPERARALGLAHIEAACRSCFPQLFAPPRHLSDGGGFHDGHRSACHVCMATVRVRVRIPVAALAEVDERARAAGVTRDDMLALLVRDGLAR